MSATHATVKLSNISIFNIKFVYSSYTVDMFLYSLLVRMKRNLHMYMHVNVHSLHIVCAP
jgi:hypothetical protein